MLELKLFYMRSHGILPYFVEKFRDGWRHEFNIVVEALEASRNIWSRSRHPFELEEGRIITPEEYFNEDRARRVIEYAERVLGVAKKYLRGKNVNVLEE